MASGRRWLIFPRCDGEKPDKVLRSLFPILALQPWVELHQRR
ncbi:hypothetical protein [Microcoleus vaginatus]